MSGRKRERRLRFALLSDDIHHFSLLYAVCTNWTLKHIKDFDTRHYRLNNGTLPLTGDRQRRSRRRPPVTNLSWTESQIHIFSSVVAAWNYSRFTSLYKYLDTRHSLQVWWCTIYMERSIHDQILTHYRDLHLEIFPCYFRVFHICFLNFKTAYLCERPNRKLISDVLWNLRACTLNTC